MYCTSMSQEKVSIRFENVTFGYKSENPLLKEACFSVREDAKLTLMGQNGAGKSTILKLITGELKPDKGLIHFSKEAIIVATKQVMAREDLQCTVRKYFSHAFEEIPHNLDKRIDDVLKVVNFKTDLESVVGELSGGQQARLLLAYALIQQPDILLLDEPTNNLDRDGIDQLTMFLIMYPKTVLVISHDADFLNSFTEGVLHLDIYTGKIDKYDGNYSDVVEEIAARVERDRAKNAQLLKTIQDRKDKINFFSHKGGKMRKLASKLRDQVEEAEENKVDERQEDKTITEFNIPTQSDIVGPMVEISSVGVMVKHEPVRKFLPTPIGLRKKQKLLISGPNGIGKSTLLQALAGGLEEGAKIGKDVKIGYYRQDFSGLDFDKTGYQSLADMMEDPWNQEIYSTASRFLLSSEILKNKVGSLSEGQKGLLCYAQFVLQKPGLLIMDEPTNHINFRHLPIIAQALDEFEGALILVSHAYEFVDQIKITNTLELDSL